MNTFVNAISNQFTRTENGMVARENSGNVHTSLFFNIGVSRGKNIIPEFVASLVDNEDLAIRIALWARDIRGGAGERKIFRDVLNYLEVYRFDILQKILPKIPEVGRFDDLFCFVTPEAKHLAYSFIGEELRKGNKLAAKWCPRQKSAKKAIANELMNFLGMTPRQYRKMLVQNTEVVETPMCSNDWDNINFEHVPSVASARYKKAFNRHTPKYKEYVDSLVKGEAKVNASSIFPHDVIKGLDFYWGSVPSKTEIDFINSQWNALPNYMGDASVLPLVDVSGSMSCIAGKKGTTKCIDVSLALGLYCADKNTGVFKDSFLTFSSKPQLVTVKGNIVEKLLQMNKSEWAMNTNLSAAFEKILTVAVQNNVRKEDMPQVLLILSDMQFDACVGGYNDTAIQMIQRKYNEAGYDVPKVVFWNLNAYDNCPVKFDEYGTALVSGFSPAILTSILKCDLEKFTPWNIMLDTIMNDKYNWR